MRDRLLGEHLGVPPEEVAQAVAAHDGRLVAAVESLRRPHGRSLVPYEPPELGPGDRALAETELLDPERTPNRWQRVRHSFRPQLSGSMTRRR
jgi:hypothetical protein